MGPPLLAAPLGSLPGAVCPAVSLVVPACQAGGALGSGLFSSVAGGLVGTGVGAVFGGVTQWVVQGAAWLLDQVGAVLSASTSVDLGAGWFTAHYEAMVALLGVVLLPLLLLAVLQAVLRQSAALLVRSVLVHLPLALLLTGAAVTLVRLVLSTTDALSTAVAAGSGTDLRTALQGLGSGLSHAAGVPGAPAFVLLLGALLVALGAFTLWVELLVRAAAVYVAVLFLPLALGSLVWPAISHWCRRLVDTLAALVLAKFVIVAILSLAVSALASGSSGGVPSVLAGGALLLLASFTPFTLLRLLPMVEAGAVHQLEGARHRLQHAVSAPLRPGAGLAMRQLRAQSLPPLSPGTGLDEEFEPAGTWLRETFGEPGNAGAPRGATRVATSGGAASAGGPAAAARGEEGPADPDPESDPDAARWRAWLDYFLQDEDRSDLADSPIPMMKGVDVPPVGYLRALEEDFHHDAPPPIHRGRPPVIGGSWFDEFDTERPPPAPAGHGQHQIGQDQVGPVIRWRPDPVGDGDGAGRPALPPGPPRGGEGTGGDA